MASDALWKKLLTPEVLKRGWHLTRNECRADFAQDFLAIEVFAIDLDQNIREISKRLATDTYQLQPLLRIDVPKGTLAVRPGAVLSIEDRIILHAIVSLIVSDIDKQFPEGVYSYRLKKHGNTKYSLFKDTDILNIPFLKKQTIVARVDPFEPWYGNWPKFDLVSRTTFKDKTYRYLSISDIAAYFENIQLAILRDQLLEYFPNDQRIINFLVNALEAWAVKSYAGRAPQRGIPQGTSISSFIGNLFLLPLDRHFVNFCAVYDAKYYRYMDDVRIFSKEIEVARRVLFEMDGVLRSLHLNVQSAKTKVLDEHLKQITHALIDSRIDDLSEICEKIWTDKKANTLSKSTKRNYLRRLDVIAKRKPDSRAEKKLLGARQALAGLSLRAFRRWITAHSLLDSPKFLDRLLKEITKNPDYRLTRRVVGAAKQFPRKQKISGKTLKFIKSDLNIFAHQEAELIHAVRYLSKIEPEVIEYCYGKVLDIDANFYVRIQCCHLLSRTRLSNAELGELHGVFKKERNQYVQTALPMILAQFKDDKNRELVRELVFHPNSRIRGVGKVVSLVKNDEKHVKRMLKFIFEKNRQNRLCDYVPFVFYMSQSKHPNIIQAVKRRVKEHRKNHPCMDLRDLLEGIYTECKNALE